MSDFTFGDFLYIQMQIILLGQHTFHLKLCISKLQYYFKKICNNIDFLLPYSIYRSSITLLDSQWTIFIKKDLNQCRRTRVIIFFLGQNLAPTLPKMQLNCCQLSQRLCCFMLLQYQLQQSHFFLNSHLYSRLHKASFWTHTCLTSFFVPVFNICRSNPQHLKTHCNGSNQSSSQLFSNPKNPTGLWVFGSR